MEIPNFEVTPEARELLADYGETMLQVQLFEFTLLGWLNALEHEPAPTGSDKDARRLETLFSLTAGQLMKRANITDATLSGLLRSAVNLRNTIVHNWLVFAELAEGRLDASAAHGQPPQGAWYRAHAS
jgi:hypothetical protein